MPPDAFPATSLPLYPGLGQASNMVACIPSGVVLFRPENGQQNVLCLLLCRCWGHDRWGAVDWQRLSTVLWQSTSQGITVVCGPLVCSVFSLMYRCIMSFIRIMNLSGGKSAVRYIFISAVFHSPANDVSVLLLCFERVVTQNWANNVIYFQSLYVASVDRIAVSFLVCVFYWYILQFCVVIWWLSYANCHSSIDGVYCLECFKSCVADGSCNTLWCIAALETHTDHNNHSRSNWFALFTLKTDNIINNVLVIMMLLWKCCRGTLIIWK